MFTVYTSAPPKKKTTITLYLYGTKRYSWLRDTCLWTLSKLDTLWSREPMQLGIIQQSLNGSCISSYLSRVKLDQLTYLLDNLVRAKALYDKNIQGIYLTQQQRKDCLCGSLYRVYVKRTAQWNSDKCKWRQPTYLIYYTVDELVSDQASYERDDLGCITKILQSLYMDRAVSSYRLLEFGGLDKLTVFPLLIMQLIEFMNWVPLQQEESCLCSPAYYNFYRFRKASFQNAVWVTDSITYLCSTNDLPVFIQGYKEQGLPCYTRSLLRQFIKAIKKKLSLQDILDIKQHLEQQDILNPPKWSTLKQLSTCSSVYRIDRHYLFDCLEVEWTLTYTDDYGLINVMPDFSLSDSKYVRTYYQNDNRGNLDYQTAYMLYVGLQAVLHVRIAKAFSDKEATKLDAVTKRYLNPKNLFCCSSWLLPGLGNSLIKESLFLIGIVAGSACVSLFKHNTSYFIEYWSTYTKKYFFSIIIGKIRGIPICINHNKYQSKLGINSYYLYPSSHVFLLTSLAVYSIDTETGLCELLLLLPLMFTSVVCTTGSCCFIATTARSPNNALYYWGSLPSDHHPYLPLANVVSIYRLFLSGTKNALLAGFGFVLCADKEDVAGSYLIYTADSIPLNGGLKLLNTFLGWAYNKLLQSELPVVKSYTADKLDNPGISYHSTSDNNIFTTYNINASPYPQLEAKASINRTALLLQHYLPRIMPGGTIWINTAVPDIQRRSTMLLYYDQWLSIGDYPTKAQYSDMLISITNKQKTFCKEQMFESVLLLRPTLTVYKPAVVYNPDLGTFRSNVRLYVLDRSLLSVDLNYVFKITFKYVWDSRFCTWNMNPITITPIEAVGLNILGYNLALTLYSGEIYTTPNTLLLSIYFKKLKPGKGCLDPIIAYKSWLSPSAVFVMPALSLSSLYTANASFCSAAYGAWFTGRTTTLTVRDSTTCYCLVYTDLTKSLILKLLGLCISTQTNYVEYNKTFVLLRPVGNVFSSIYVYNCLVQNRGELITFYSCTSHLFCRVYWLFGGSIHIYPYTMEDSFVISNTEHPTVFTYIEYRDILLYNIYAVYLSLDATQLLIKIGQILASLAHQQVPRLENYVSYYKGLNPSNLLWKAMARYFGGHIVLMSTTHLGILRGITADSSYLLLIELDQLYSSLIDTITAPWFNWGSIFVTLTKDNKQVVFLSYNNTSYIKHVVNISVPTDQSVCVTGVSSYDTQEIGVVLGPYTICTVDYKSFDPYQRATLIKFKLLNGLAVVSYNKLIILGFMSELHNTKPHAYNSCSGITYSFDSSTAIALNAVVKSYDKDLVIFNLYNSWQTYELDIKTGQSLVAKLDS